MNEEKNLNQESFQSSLLSDSEKSKRKMRKISKKTSLALITGGILIFIFALVGQTVFLPPDPNSNFEVNLSIEKGESLSEIAFNLKNKKLIKSEFVFKGLALITQKGSKIKAGLYLLSPSMNMIKVLNKISLGETIKKEVTIIEGWTLRDIGWHFENQGNFTAEELFEIAGFPAVNYEEAGDLPEPVDFSEKFEFLKEKPENISLEGYLFPDTYQFYPNASPRDIVEKMLSNFEIKISGELKKKIASQGKTLFEILTMASILEKEIKTKEEKKTAAGVLWKRIKSGWPLQVDATLTYLTGKDSSSLAAEDFEIDSLYNAYKYYGLPLGPICNPGLESIEAAVYFVESPYWFYLTTGEGKAVFSRTLEEHNINREKYLK